MSFSPFLHRVRTPCLPPMLALKFTSFAFFMTSDRSIFYSCMEGLLQADRERWAIFSVVGDDGRNPPAEAGLRAINWRLCFAEGSTKRRVAGCRTVRFAESSTKRTVLPCRRFHFTGASTKRRVPPCRKFRFAGSWMKRRVPRYFMSTESPGWPIDWKAMPRGVKFWV